MDDCKSPSLLSLFFYYFYFQVCKTTHIHLHLGSLSPSVHFNIFFNYLNSLLHLNSTEKSKTKLVRMRMKEEETNCCQQSFPVNLIYNLIYL